MTQLPDARRPDVPAATPVALGSPAVEHPHLVLAHRPTGGRHRAAAVTRPPRLPRLPLVGGRPAGNRRRSLYLAAALAGAAGAGMLGTVVEAPAQADDAGTRTSVAQALALAEAQTPTLTDTDAAARLETMAASRAERTTEEAQAAAVQASADQAVLDAAAEAARPQAVLPVSGARLTSTFGYRWGTLHAGIDLAAPMDTPEMAAMDGVVLEAGPASGFGLAVYIQHANGDVTVYGHMDQILVTAGQTVQAGDVIALLGNRGQSTGPHLHFEVHAGGIDGERIDPIPWLLDRGVDVSAATG